MPIGIFAKGILKTVPHLEVFLGDSVVLNPKGPDGLTAIAGWGYKPTAKKAIKKAREWNLPYWALEDGFIRSIGLGFEEPPLSIVIDPVGIYYDASKPSLIENLLNSGDRITDEILQKAKRLRQIIIECEISKYNNSKPLPKALKEELKDKEVVLVVDQTYNDMSVVMGLADEKTFIDMYYSALEENPKALVLIKTHPDVIKGKKKGYLTNIKYDSARTILLFENYNPIALLKLVGKVYTVTSQMGLEAILLDKEVHCFGVPFYAGWGLTKDRKKVERRKRKVSVDELTAVAYLLYPKYALLNGSDYRLADAFEVIEFIRKKQEQFYQSVYLPHGRLF